MSKSNIGETLSKIDFLEFNSVEESVKSDVEFLTTNPLIVKESWVYDVQSGKVRSSFGRADWLLTKCHL